MTTAAPEALAPKAASGRRWEGPVLPMDSDSDDGRQYRSDITIAELPLPLSWQRIRQDKHDGAVMVGSIDRVEFRAGVLWAFGEMFDPEEFSGQDADDIRAATNIIRLGLGLVSADALARTEVSAGRIVQSGGLFKGATLVGLPAFQEARVRMTMESFGLQVPEVVSDTDWEPAHLLDCADGLCQVEFALTGDTELPTVERGSAVDRAWDNGAAFDAIFTWAGKGTPEGPDVSKLSKAFLYRNPARDPQTKWAWKIPIATVVGGELRIVPQAVFNASTVVSGGRSPVDIPAAELSNVKAKLARLYKRVGYVPPSDRKNPRIVEKVTASASDPEAPCLVCTSEIDEMMSKAMAEVLASIDAEMGGHNG